jgi:hypothetical protein
LTGTLPIIGTSIAEANSRRADPRLALQLAREREKKTFEVTESEIEMLLPRDCEYIQSTFGIQPVGVYGPNGNA